MRISDWSSDVCSSDLADGIRKNQADGSSSVQARRTVAQIDDASIVDINPVGISAGAAILFAQMGHGIILLSARPAQAFRLDAKNAQAGRDDRAVQGQGAGIGYRDGSRRSAAAAVRIVVAVVLAGPPAAARPPP